MLRTTSLTFFLICAGVLALAIAFSSQGKSDSVIRASDLPSISEGLADLAARTRPGTVYLEVEQEVAGAFRERKRGGMGSGFVVDAVQGFVVTNAHVVGGPNARVTVVLADGRRDSGTVIGIDARSDVALVRISPGLATHQLEWGNSDAVRPGHLVLALGSPLGRTFSTSFGVVSALGRTDLQLPEKDAYQDFIQFDAFIDHGSSGGPLLDMDGRVVGINTAIGGRLDAWQGISYAVPESLARRVVEGLATSGETRRGWLGVTTSGGEVTAAYAESVGLDRPYGVRVRKVTQGSPAEESGILRGDIILAVDGYEISSHERLRSRLAALGPGVMIHLRIWRDSAFKTIEVTLGERP
ncbi:MAG TPA: hypothetical protein DDW23_07095 [Planctomycetes bacterium]|nr:hypothetical protein [Planctomycetota bacterium]